MKRATHGRRNDQVCVFLERRLRVLPESSGLFPPERGQLCIRDCRPPDCQYTSECMADFSSQGNWEGREWTDWCNRRRRCGTPERDESSRGPCSSLSYMPAGFGTSMTSDQKHRQRILLPRSGVKRANGVRVSSKVTHGRSSPKAVTSLGTSSSYGVCKQGRSEPSAHKRRHAEGPAAGTCPETCAMRHSREKKKRQGAWASSGQAAGSPRSLSSDRTHLSPS